MLLVFVSRFVCLAWCVCCFVVDVCVVCVIWRLLVLCLLDGLCVVVVLCVIGFLVDGFFDVLWLLLFCLRAF